MTVPANALRELLIANGANESLLLTVYPQMLRQRTLSIEALSAMLTLERLQASMDNHMVLHIFLAREPLPAHPAN